MLQAWVMVADLVSPVDSAARATGRMLPWLIPVAVVFVIIAVARRRKRTRL
jgi:hypothetical protein